MCIAIVRRPYAEISEEALHNCAVNNPDGFGFTYVREDITGVRKLIIKKTMDYEIFIRQYRRAVKLNPESVFLIHFRIATHGTVNKFNCHPFRVNKNMTFIHNGIITGVGVDSLKSDTQLFNEKVLKVMPKGFEKVDGIKLLLEKFLSGSKLATLDIDGNYTIYNESAGHWKDNVWYSNYSYSYGKRVVTTYYGSGYGQYDTTKKGKKDRGAGATTAAGSTKSLPLPIHYLCDGCGIRHSEHDCTFFLSRREPFCYCKDCVTVAYFNGTVNLTDKISRAKYSRELNQYTYAYDESYQGVDRFMD